MNSNSLSSGPASIPDFAPLTDAFDMTPTPSEADAMSVRATVSMEVKANVIRKKKKKKKNLLDVFIWLVAQGKTLTVIAYSVLIFILWVQNQIRMVAILRIVKYQNWRIV